MSNITWKEITLKCPYCLNVNTYQFPGIIDYTMHVKCHYCNSVFKLSGSKINQAKEELNNGN